MNGYGKETKSSISTPLIGGMGSKKGTFILQRQGSHNVESTTTGQIKSNTPNNIRYKQTKNSTSLYAQEQFAQSPQAINFSPQSQEQNNNQKISQTAISPQQTENQIHSQVKNSTEQMLQHRRSSARTPQVKRLTNQFYIVRKEFDPFKSPPDLDLAEKHRKARIVGEATEEQKLDNENYCPCCYSIIEKNPIPISCDEKELAFLGVGYAQIFLLNKYFGFLVLVIFVLGGSLLLLVRNQLQRESNCLSILGIAVMANKDKDIQLMPSYVQILVAMLIIAAVLYVKKKISKKITKFNEGYISPCEYSIMVQNLPLDIKKEELKRHFEKLMNRQIVCVNMAYDTEKYNHNIEQKCQDIKTYNTTKYQIKLLMKQMEQPNLPQKQINSLTDKIKQLEDKNEFLASEMKITDEFIERFEKDCDNDCDPSKFLGTAFITFHDTVPVNTIIEEWGYTYVNILKFIIFRWIKPPFIEYKNKLLVIRKAPAPADIIWENLRYSLPRNIVNNTLMLFMSCFILYLSFKIQFFVMEMVYPLKKESYEEHSFVLMIRGSLLSLCVVIVNLSLRNTVFFFTKCQKFDHHTKLLNAYVNKYIFLYFFNSAFMPYLVHGQLDANEVNIELLVWDIHFIILATSISTPLAKLFDPVMLFKMYKRWHIKSFNPEDCPYTQKEANYWMEGHPMETADSYAYMARVLFLGAWYAQVAPLGILFSMIGLVCNHFIDKYFLLRVHATPELITEEVYSKIIFALDLLPFIYLCGGIEYNQKSLISTNFTNEGQAIVGLFFTLLAFIFHYKRTIKLKAAKKETRLYHQVRTLFHTEYDRSNPVTATKASMNYIKFLYDQKALYLSANMQEMVAINSQKKYKKHKKHKHKNKELIMNGTNINHLIESGSQQYKENFMNKNQVSKQEIQNLHQQSDSSDSSDESDSDDEHDIYKGMSNKDSSLQNIEMQQVQPEKNNNQNISDSNNQHDENQSTKARQGTVLIGQRQSTPSMNSNQFATFTHGHSAFNFESMHQRDSLDTGLPLQFQEIKKVESEQVDEEQLIQRILQKQDQRHSQLSHSSLQQKQNQ